MLKYIKLSLIAFFIPVIVAYISFGQSIAIAQDDALTTAVQVGVQSNEQADATSAESLDTPLTPEESLAQEVKEAEPEEVEVLVEAEKEEKKAEVVDTEFALPKRFGYDFFLGARNRIKRLEAILAGTAEDLPAPWRLTPSRYVPTEQVILEQAPLGYVSEERITARETPLTRVASTTRTAKDAISGFVGPVEMMGSNVDATVPSKYVLGSGDRITLNFWSDVVEPQTVSLVVDTKGEVILPAGAGKMVVRGMTLAQFQEAAKDVLTRIAYKDLTLIATLDGLRSIQIFIYGEAFRPGSYNVSAVTTLFNALYMCGGPSNNGSLRNIKLLRDKETIPVDFYKVLMDGDSSQDINLDAGDTIFIPPVGRTATISGEVKRPNEYELRENENLLQIVSMAGGIKPGGFLQRVQIDSVHPGSERIVLDVDLSDQVDAPIFDGDTVTVFSIPSERMNTVTLEGKVRMPGTYELKDGMKISDLIREAQWLLGEAHMERADLLRLNADKKTTKLIPINLSKALAGDSAHDIALRQWDKLIVYSKWDVKWIADRVVNAAGAVQRSGSYERSDGMTVRDLLILAGGTLPDAYLDEAFLLRLDARAEMTKTISVNLKDVENSPLLEDGDGLLVYTYREIRWEPKREVTVEGAIQTPAVLPRVEGMKVSDLIERAGGLLPNAYPDRALLLRLDERQRTTLGFFISPELALQNDPKNDLNLKDGDKLRIYTYQEVAWEPKREVRAVGVVQNPGIFERFDGMKVSDLLYRAGGVLPNAYLERASIRRFQPDHETFIAIPVNLTRVLSGDAEADALLEDEDVFVVYTLREAQYKPENVVTIYGAVQRPDIYTRTVGMKLSDLLFIAGGLLPGVHKEAEITRIDDDGKTFIQIVDVIALSNGDSGQDILLSDEDVVSIRKQTEFLDALRTVIILGEVKYPGSYALKRSERLSDLITRAGGLTDRAYPEASVITRNIEHLTLEEQKKSSQQVKKLLEDLSQMEYQRQVAKALLIEQRHKGKGAPASISGLSIPSNISITDELYTGQSTITEIAELAAVSGIPEQAEAAISEIGDMSQLQYQYTLVTPARKVGSFLPTGRVVVDLKEAIRRPETDNDIILEDGDRILIPAMPATISVSGAVIQPSSLVYMKSKSVKDYIEMVGGYARDADKDAVYVVRANGMVTKGDNTRLSPGDMIVVSTKVIVEKVTDRWGQVIGALKFVVTTLAMAYTIKLIVEQVK